MESRGEEGHLQAAVARRRAGPLGQLLEDLEAGRDVVRLDEAVGLVEREEATGVDVHDASFDKIPDLEGRARHDIHISLPQGLFGFLRIYTTDEQRALDVRVLQIPRIGFNAVVGLLG